MGKHESVQGIREQGDLPLVPSGETPLPISGLSGGSAVVESAKIALANLEALKIEPKSDLPRIALSGIGAFPRFTTPTPDVAQLRAEHQPEYQAQEAPADEPMAREEPADEEPRRRISPFTMMVASLGGAAAVGAMLGAIIASGIAKPTPVATGPKVGVEEINALKEQVVQARVELAALKSSFDAGHRSANQQFTKISERVERMERVQADPVAKLTKAVESLERVRRAEAATTAAAHPPEVTGSITPPQAPPQQAAGKPGVVDGWVLRDVHRGTAFIEGRMGIIEVDQGDMVPGLGRVDAIRKQDGRWVVVTSKGLIVPPK